MRMLASCIISLGEGPTQCQLLCGKMYFFFFQAEDGIRDTSVTGVQTCALPISPSPPPPMVWRCSGTSQVLPGCPTSQVRSSSAYVLRLPDTSHGYCCLGTAALGGLGISRFPNEVLAYVHGVSDRAGLGHTSRYRCTRWCLPHLLTASASRRKVLTRLNTRPARSPVNASTLPLRAAPHDSGPMWVANPLLPYDFCIHYTSPV